MLENEPTTQATRNTTRASHHPTGRYASRNVSPYARTIALLFALLAGYVAGAVMMRPAPSHAQAGQVDAGSAGEQGTSTTALGVTIPDQGAALVRGADGFAYVVSEHGQVIQAKLNGKPLKLK